MKCELSNIPHKNGTIIWARKNKLILLLVNYCIYSVIVNFRKSVSTLLDSCIKYFNSSIFRTGYQVKRTTRPHSRYFWYCWVKFIIISKQLLLELSVPNYYFGIRTCACEHAKVKYMQTIYASQMALIVRLVLQGFNIKKLYNWISTTRNKLVRRLPYLQAINISLMRFKDRLL